METRVVKSKGRPRKRRRGDSPNEENRDLPDDISIGGDVGDCKNGEQSKGSSRRRGCPPKKRALEMSSVVMLGRYVLKEFDGNGIFLGKIVSYDSGLYRVNYEDGDREDLDSGELRQYLIKDEQQRFVGDLLERRKKLDEAVDDKRAIKQEEKVENGVMLKDKPKEGVKLIDEPKDGVKLKDQPEESLNLKDEAEEGVHFKFESENCLILKDAPVKVVDVDPLCTQENMDVTKSIDIMAGENAGNVLNDLRIHEVTTLNDIPCEDVSSSAAGNIDDGDKDGEFCFEDDDSDTLSDYCEYGQGWEERANSVFPEIPPPELPPSSGTTGIPEEYVSHLFSVHGFLRTFSVHLFLSPFTLDDLVGCLKCTVPNSLLDAIHVALLRALRRHLERLASEGSEPASKCLKSLDWDLLDTLTWSVYLVYYLMAMGHLNGSEWKGFYFDVLEKEYYTLPIGIKVTALQILCDDALDTEEIRSEIDTREESEVGFNGISSDPCERGSILNPNAVTENNISFTSNMVKCDDHNGETGNAGEDGNLDECRLCGMEGMLICCDGCPSAYHSRCIGVNKLSIPNGKWFCAECTISSIGPPITNGTLLRGAEVFGLDSFAQLFLGTCDHLLVLKVPLKASSFVRYYNRDDVQKVLSVLSSCPFHSISYLEICQGISKYWGLPQVVVSPPIVNKASTILDEKDDYRLLPFHSQPSDENRTSSVGESSIYDVSGSGYEKLFLKFDSDDISVGAPIQNNFRSLPRTPCVRQNAILKKKDTCLYMGSVFKPLAYINNYVHGAYAASAAANFGSLSSDESQASEIHASDPRKAMAASVSLQVKAFSSAAVRFFWPSTEKKLFEIPRERCSWCFHCKATITYRKGCILNQAAVSATRAEMKFISGLRLEKIGGGFYGIAAYALFMEGSCRGLIHGSFRCSSYRELWRKKVEQASTCSEIKALLLDLERNLCMIALSSEWTRLVDTWMDECSVPQSAAASGSVQKRVAGKRKKNLAVPEVTDNEPSDSNEFTWWRGGKLAKLLFQRGTLPRQVLRKAARQGASRRLPGIYYASGSDVPKRSRQFIWRGGVEMAKNASQLALQVRYLDQHIKWSDLARPEQNPVDGKGPETEALAFRNAHICDKKIFENKNLYGVAFGHQKHLSSRLMKSIIEKEEIEDGKHKYWFPEARIPLYLIKEYEEKVEIPDLSPIKPDCYSKHQRWQLKAARKDIFVYLALKRDDLHVCPCASCQKDVFLELAVTCNSCEGYCHTDCMLNSTELANKDIECRATCKQCSIPKAVSQSNNSVESPTSPLVMQGKDFQNSAAVSKSGKLKSSSNSKSKKNKSSNSEKRSSLHRGLIWKKKKGSKDDGSDFLRRNVICTGSSDGLAFRPACYVCTKPYSPNLTYIRCGSCENWFHAEAVALDDFKIPFLVGFKCCNCSKTKPPDCPYSDLPPKKTEIKRLRVNGPKQETLEADSISEAISEQAESFPSTPSLVGIEDDIFIDMDDDSLSLPASQIQMADPKSEMDFEWNNFQPGPQKLEVRRHTKNEKDDGGLTWDDLSSAQLPTSTETIYFPEANVQEDACNGLEDGTTLNYDNLNFESDYEPQTYFSFTELLETDGGNNQLEGVAPSTEVWDDFPCEEYSRTGFMDQCNVNSFEELNPTISTEPSVGIRCEACQGNTPAPNMGCQICGIQVHHYCLPQEEVFQGNSWICGQCREWS